MTLRNPARSGNPAVRAAAKSEPSRIDPVTTLWFSNAPWAGTGYGTQTAQVVERMQRDGHPVAVSANYGLQAMTTEWNGIPIYPMGYENYSNDVAAANFKHWSMRHPENPAHLFVLFDAWVLKGPHWDELPVSIWTMVDHVPVPVGVSNVLKKPNITPIAVTEFGRQEIERQGIHAEYIPMAIDTTLYKPTAEYQGVTGRKMMELPEDAFVVSIINANKDPRDRKAFGENILAFSIFAESHPDARLYIHSERYGNMGGLQFDLLLRAVGLKPHQYSFVNQYANHVGIPNEAMAALYTATDVLLAASKAEGFGLTVLEAGSCGTRVIANNFSAQPEMVSTDSWLTEGQPMWDMTQMAWQNTPNIPSIVDALEEAYRKGHNRSQAQMAHAAKYDADLIWDTHWRPYMARIAKGDIGGNASALPASFAPPKQWTNAEPDPDVRLTIYIPTYRRREIADLLTSLAPQLSHQVEVIISDNDPTGSAFSAVSTKLNCSPSFVEYSRRTKNIGGEANILRGYEVGHADWVWVIGDDDTVLPTAVSDVLEAIDHDDVDRLILLSQTAPSSTAGMIGSLQELAKVDPALPIAATLITANVVRRRSLDLHAAQAHIGTMYSHSWANTSCHRVRVLNGPVITVGRNHVSQFADEAGFSGDISQVWTELLNAYGIEAVGPEHFAWNFASA